MKPNFFHYFSRLSAEGGSLDCIRPGETPISPISSGKIVLPVQVHGTKIVEVTNPEDVPGEADALICGVPHIPIGVRTADCVPVLLYSSDIGYVAAIHAGWRGALAGIAAAAARELIARGADASRMLACIGPHICAGCYEVDSDLAARFSGAGYSDCVKAANVSGKSFLDLGNACRNQLIKAGLDPKNIDETGFCTKCSHNEAGQPVFPSWRREAGTKERLVTFIERMH